MTSRYVGKTGALLAVLGRGLNELGSLESVGGGRRLLLLVSSAFLDLKATYTRTEIDKRITAPETPNVTFIHKGKGALGVA